MLNSQLEVQDKAGSREMRQLWRRLLAGNMLGERLEAGTAVSSLTCCHRCVQWSPVAPGECDPGLLLTDGMPGAGSGRKAHLGAAQGTHARIQKHLTLVVVIHHTRSELPVKAGEEMRSKTRLPTNEWPGCQWLCSCSSDLAAALADW